MREVVFDVESTGVNTATDRIVEVGAVELVDLMPTGRTFHSYVNPQQEVPIGAFKVHGLDYAFLKSHPTFRRVAPKFLDFVGDARLVAHNGDRFDVPIVNAELARLGLPLLANVVIDSLSLARKAKPGGKHNLDALCRHYGIDNSHRTLHGALLDSEILAEVYLHLHGGRQFGMQLAETAAAAADHIPVGDHGSRVFTVRSTVEEREAHDAFVAGLGGKSIWRQYLGGTQP